MSKLPLIALCLIFANTGFAQDNKPQLGTYNSYQTQIKLFKKINKRITLYNRLAAGSLYNDKSAFQATLGSYYKIFKKQKIDFNISHQMGNRHTDDWINENDEWLWNDTSDRYESIISIGHIYSDRISDSNFVFQTRFHFEKNYFNQQERLITKPKISYFIFGNKGPLFSLHYSSPFYYALNFERNSFYKRGHYLGLLYHYSTTYQIGINYQQRMERWTNSKEFKDRVPNKDYDIEDTVNVLTLELIIQI